MFKREEYGLVLDFLPHGKAGEAQREPVAQLIGESYFTLLEVVVKPDAQVKGGDRIYIGKEERDKVDHIKGRIAYGQLTSSAQADLHETVRKIVKSREPDFVNFINRAGPINIRCHALEQLPSVGKKHLVEILDARDRKQFTSFQDIHDRIPHIGNVEDIFVHRIIDELKETSKYYMFVKMPSQHEEEFHR
jgi:putative nucleotide binding protein